MQLDLATDHDRIALATALLGDAAVAVAALSAADAEAADLMDICVHRLGIDPSRLMARAAQVLGLSFSPTVPRGPAAPEPARIDSLAELRSLRGTLNGRDRLFVSPNFAGLVALQQQLRSREDLAERICLTPISALRSELAHRHGAALSANAQQRLTRLWPHASAATCLSQASRVILVSVMALLVVLTTLAPFVWQAWLFPIAAVLMLLPACMRIAALITSRSPGPPAPALPDAQLPTYTVLIPLRDEASMVSQLARAMSNLDYPPDKLDIKFVVEGRSPETIAAVREVLRNPIFELVIVPDGMPRTKPKAMNYALPLARGSLLVIYDAEDIPDAKQLRLAAERFAAEPQLDCLQAELVIDNGRENWLTGAFAGEYAGLFGLMLPALARWRLPLPLGGTSNHFRLQSLRELGAWDAFNVTEDADLGVRMARLRYRTATLTSRTREEAPVEPEAWMRQRTRWMKGWMQTIIVHNTHAGQTIRDLGWLRFLWLEIYLGSLVVSPVLHSIFLIVLLARIFLAQVGVASGIDIWTALHLVLLVVGYGSALALTLAGLDRIGKPRLRAIQMVLPLYWVLLSAATYAAARELLSQPYFWAKTQHGQTRLSRRISR